MNNTDNNDRTPTHHGLTKRQTVKREEEERTFQITHAENDKHDYSAVSNRLLSRYYPDVNLDGYDQEKFNEDALFKPEDEDGISKNGYIPEYGNGEVIGNSGVTIGFGFDIGQKNAHELGKIITPDSELYKKLEPYLGKTKKEAQEFLKKNPLVLSEGESLAVTRAVYAHTNNKVKERFDGVNGKGAYDKLNNSHRTAILSYAILNGPNGKNGTWNNVLLKNDYQGVKKYVYGRKEENRWRRVYESME